MKRTPLVAGNWKMNTGTPSQAITLAEAIAAAAGNKKGAEVLICPPFTALVSVGKAIEGKGIALGAQNAHAEAKGAFTGEISVPMLKEIGCAYVILGHSERRQLFGETDEGVCKKTAAVLAAGLKAIVCVGETLQQRQANQTWAVIETQLNKGLEGISATAANLVIAYEPVWAIGTGLNATPAQAQEVHASIRKWLNSRFGPETGSSIRIQYGGSVKADNAKELMSQHDVDGALVGGASLEAASFIAIIEAASQAKEGSPCCTA